MDFPWLIYTDMDLPSFNLAPCAVDEDLFTGVGGGG